MNLYNIDIFENVKNKATKHLSGSNMFINPFITTCQSL